MFILRRATPEDAALLFAWRDDPVTRENSINQEPLTWEAHMRWLTSSLESASRMLFVGMDGDVPVGTSRVDRTAADLEISYSVAANHRGKGYGRALVRETLRHCNDRVKASVRAHNHASRKILKRAGFHLSAERDG